MLVRGRTTEPVNEHLQRQLAFIEATDALKGVSRRTRPIGLSRRENSAEHSWQAALTAMVLAEHSNETIDLLRVISMLLIHDVPEVDVGDVFHYDKEATVGLAEKEKAAAQRLFGLLPPAQSAHYLALWEEFEARQTPEARFAAAVDRFMAFIMNSRNDGGTWVEYRLATQQVLEKNRHIVDGAAPIWDAVNEIVDKAGCEGHLRPAE